MQKKGDKVSQMKNLIISLGKVIELNKHIIQGTDFKKLNLKRMSPLVKKSPIKQKPENDEEAKIQDVHNSYIDTLFYKSEQGYSKSSYTNLPNAASETKVKIRNDYREKFKLINEKYYQQFPTKIEVKPNIYNITYYFYLGAKTYARTKR